VTGFGLLGHAMEMAQQSGVTIEIASNAVPRHPTSLELAAAGRLPSGSRDNLAYVAPHVSWDPQVSEGMRSLLADAVTSGGLLVAMPPERVEAFIAGAKTLHRPVPIGRVHAAAGPPVAVR
jgi:selenide,water dikinase